MMKIKFEIIEMFASESSSSTLRSWIAITEGCSSSSSGGSGGSSAPGSSVESTAAAATALVVDAALRSLIARDFDAEAADRSLLSSYPGRHAERFEQLLGSGVPRRPASATVGAAAAPPPPPQDDREWRGVFVDLAAEQAAAAARWPPRDDSLVLRYAGRTAMAEASTASQVPNAALLATLAGFKAFERLLTELLVELAAARWPVDPLRSDAAVCLAIAASEAMAAPLRALMPAALGRSDTSASRGASAGSSDGHASSSSDAAAGAPRRWASAALREKRWRYGGACSAQDRVADDVVADIVFLATRHSASFLFTWRLLSTLAAEEGPHGRRVHPVASPPPPAPASSSTALQRRCARLLQQLELEARTLLSPLRASRLLDAAARVEVGGGARQTDEAPLDAATRRLCAALVETDATADDDDEVTGSEGRSIGVPAALHALTPLLMAALSAPSYALTVAARRLRQPRIIDALIVPFFAVVDVANVDFAASDDAARAARVVAVALTVGGVGSAETRASAATGGSGASQPKKRKREEDGADTGAAESTGGAVAAVAQLQRALLECATVVGSIVALWSPSGDGGTVRDSSSALLAQLERCALAHPLLAREASRWCARFYASESIRALQRRVLDERRAPSLCSEDDLALLRAGREMHVQTHPRDGGINASASSSALDRRRREPATRPSLLRIVRACAVAFPLLRGDAIALLLSMLHTCDSVAADAEKRSAEMEEEGVGSLGRGEEQELRRLREDMRRQQAAVLSSAIAIALRGGGGGESSAAAAAALWPLLRYLVGPPPAGGRGFAIGTLLLAHFSKRELVVHAVLEVLCGIDALAAEAMERGAVALRALPASSAMPVAAVVDAEAVAFALLRLITQLSESDLLLLGISGGGARGSASGGGGGRVGGKSKGDDYVWTPLAHRYSAKRGAGAVKRQPCNRIEVRSFLHFLHSYEILLCCCLSPHAHEPSLSTGRATCSVVCAALREGRSADGGQFCRARSAEERARSAR